MEDIVAAAVRAVGGGPCPQNSALALLARGGMASGEVMKVIVDDGEPIEDVPPSLSCEGHEILERDQREDGKWVLLVRAA